ncbi:MAG: ribonuclease D [Granulosicoccaceae bacterium]
MTKENNSWQLVDTQESLDQLSQRLLSVNWVAIDTEFMREKTYYPVLCLIQLATPDWAVCVDPMADLSLKPLLDALYSPNLLKIFHAAEQDLELFNQMKGTLPPNLFDTQIAAPLLGFPEQVGYGRLVEMICGRALDKSQTRTDWSRRPLSEAQLQYAADDVIELVKIYVHLQKQLEDTARTDWLSTDWQRLADPERFNRSPDRAWERLKGLDRLSKKARGAAQQLAIWRETVALERNRPRNWILKDAVLIDIAKQLPRNPESLSRVRGLPEPVLKRDGHSLLKAVSQGQNSPLPLSKKVNAQPLSESQEAAVDALSAIVRLKGLEHSINPQVLASRKVLEKYLRGEDQTLNSGWRGKLLADTLNGFLSGELHLELNSQAELQLRG